MLKRRSSREKIIFTFKDRNTAFVEKKNIVSSVKIPNVMSPFNITSFIFPSIQ